MEQHAYRIFLYVIGAIERWCRRCVFTFWAELDGLLLIVALEVIHRIYLLFIVYLYYILKGEQS